MTKHNLIQTVIKPVTTVVPGSFLTTSCAILEVTKYGKNDDGHNEVGLKIHQPVPDDGAYYFRSTDVGQLIDVLIDIKNAMEMEE